MCLPVQCTDTTHLARAANDLPIAGYVAIWHTRDCYKTYFDPAKPPNLGLGEDNATFLPIRLMYEHALPGVLPERLVIGELTTLNFDETGIAFKGTLYNAERMQAANPMRNGIEWDGIRNRIAREIQQGLLATSSATSPHLAEFDEDGRFYDWFLIEVSLTKRPCEETMPKVRIDANATNDAFTLAYVEAIVSPATATGDSHRDCGCSENRSETDPPQTQATTQREDGTLTPIPSNRSSNDGGQTMAATQTPAEIKRALEDYGIPTDAPLQPLFLDLVTALGGKQVALDLLAQIDMGAGEAGAAPMEEQAVFEQALLSVLSDKLGSKKAVTDKIMEIAKSGVDMAERSQVTSAVQLWLTKQTAPAPQRSQANTEDIESKIALAVEAAMKKAQTDASQAQQVAENQTLRNRDQNGGVEFGAPLYIQNMAEKAVYARQSPEKLAGAAMWLASAQQAQGANIKFPRCNRSPVFWEALVNGLVDYTKKESNTRAANLDRVIPYRSHINRQTADSLSLRADEVMGTGNTGNGAEWVGVFYDDQVWEAIWEESVLLERLVSLGMMEKDVPRGYASTVIPIEGSRPTIGFIVRNYDVDDTTLYPKPIIQPSTPTTNNRTLSLGTFGGYVPYDNVWTLETVFDAVSFMEQQMTQAQAEAIERTIISGDTTIGANVNINYYDGTVSADATTGQLPYFAGFNGFLHIPLVDTTSLGIDGGDTLTENMPARLLQTLGLNGKTARMLYICDYGTHVAMRTLPAFKDASVLGERSTMVGNMIETLYGIDIYSTNNMEAADDNGKVSATPANNTYGRLMLVRPDRFVFGRRPEVRRTTMYHPNSDAYTFHSYIDFGFVAREVTNNVALIYELNRTISIS